MKTPYRFIHKKKSNISAKKIGFNFNALIVVNTELILLLVLSFQKEK